jgi:hypothetical protein
MMGVVLPLSLGLIVVGLLMVWLCSHIKQAGLQAIVYWTGIVLVIIGLILLVTPVLIWVYGHLKAALGSS